MDQDEGEERKGDRLGRRGGEGIGRKIDQGIGKEEEKEDGREQEGRREEKNIHQHETSITFHQHKPRIINQNPEQNTIPIKPTHLNHPLR